MFLRVFISLTLISMVSSRPHVGLASGMPAGGISGDNTDASSLSIAEANLNNAPALQKIRGDKNKKRSEKVIVIDLDNTALADTITPRKLTDIGVGITSDRLGVLPPSFGGARTIGGHVGKFFSKKIKFTRHFYF